MNPTIDELIAGLHSKKPVERQRCRHQLVQAGPLAIEPLTALLNADDADIRWEAAKALVAIADECSIPALIGALEDNDTRVRWDAALGLVRIGRPSVEPLLQAVIDRSQAGVIWEGAQHVIHELKHTTWGKFLQPVYEAFDASEPAVAAPVAAAAALKTWRGQKQRCTRNLQFSRSTVSPNAYALATCTTRCSISLRAATSPRSMVTEQSASTAIHTLLPRTATIRNRAGPLTSIVSSTFLLRIKLIAANPFEMRVWAINSTEELTDQHRRFLRSDMTRVRTDISAKTNSAPGLYSQLARFCSDCFMNLGTLAE